VLFASFAAAGSGFDRGAFHGDGARFDQAAFSRQGGCRGRVKRLVARAALSTAGVASSTLKAAHRVADVVRQMPFRQLSLQSLQQ